MTDATFEQLVFIVSEQFKKIETLNKQLEDLDTLYKELSDDYLKLQLEKIELEQALQTIDSDTETEVCAHDVLEDIIPVPVDEMATTTPNVAEHIDSGMFTNNTVPSLARVTGTTSDKCYALTAVLEELDQGVSVSKRILMEQNLFEYRADESGRSRYTPTDWFREYAIDHNILAEFTGNANSANGTKTFTWYKVTPSGIDTIKRTATGEIVWKQFWNGDHEYAGYIPVTTSRDETNN
jgi:hypothetical protein